jgi:hypothetical protein
VLIAGDVNCVISPADYTGKPMSRALHIFIKGMGLRDVWETHQQAPRYTHYTNEGASRIDRIYITDTLQHRKQGAETVAAAFSDNFAVTVLMALRGTSTLRRARIVENEHIPPRKVLLPRKHQGAMGKMAEIHMILP